MAVNNDTILALDVGERRIGVASAHAVARFPGPLKTIDMSANTVATVQQLVQEQAAGLIVVGLPRNLSGLDTDQTRYVRAFAAQLEAAGLKTAWQDEALTSKKAEQELQSRGKPYARGDIDALAATYILEDYLRDHPGELF